MEGRAKTVYIGLLNIIIMAISSQSNGILLQRTVYVLMIFKEDIGKQYYIIACNIID